MESTAAIRYNKFSRALLLIWLFLQLGLLFLFENFGWSVSFARYSLHLAGNYYAALVFYWSAIHLALTVILAAANAGSYVVERSHQLTRQSYGSWLADYLKRRLINWIVTSLGAVWFYCAVRGSSEHWYLWFWPAIVLFYASVLLLIDSVFLPLFYKVVPLESGATFERLSLLANRAGIARPKFALLRVGHKTPRSNAVVTGMAGRYRILVTDTALESLTPEEIEAIVAHELGHQVKHHTTTRLLMLAGLYFFPLWLASLLLPELIPDLSNFACLPYLFIALWVASQYIRILFGIFARTQEKAADRFCWKLTGNVPAFISMMRKLAAQNLMMTKKRVASSHPAIDSRIAAAEKFLEQQQRAAVSAGHPA